MPKKSPKKSQSESTIEEDALKSTMQSVQESILELATETVTNSVKTITNDSASEMNRQIAAAIMAYFGGSRTVKKGLRTTKNDQEMIPDNQEASKIMWEKPSADPTLEMHLRTRVLVLPASSTVAKIP
uniref:Uncharacterized protein n=1 Tax=Cannabis sativa TaxID=3483 RepID=A0A803P3V4_CANSA